MTVSVVVCTYNRQMKPYLTKCIDSLLNQTYPVEVICIVDGNEPYYYDLLKSLPPAINLYFNLLNQGLSYSRNKGAKKATGDVVAFIDDDAVADREWVEELARCYWDGAIAVGGKLLPLWSSKKPFWFPEEFYWMIGATHKGFAEKKEEVRNTFGSNLSFRKEVFEALGGFREDTGMKGGGQLQGAETELCDRMRREYGQGVMYNPNAVVYHNVFSNRLKLGFLLRRAYWQGVSKHRMSETGSELGEEKGFLREVLTSPVRVLMLYMFTFMVLMGYVRSKLFG